MIKQLIILTIAMGMASTIAASRQSLDIGWEYGLGRNYKATTVVPSIVLEAGKKENQRLWYRRTVRLPKGNWSRARIELYGARFLPKVYVNGELVSSTSGGMSLTIHPLAHPQVRPGTTITLEIELSPLSEVSQKDASFIPPTDQWRSNVSSCLWDDVVLHTDAGARVVKILPHFEIERDNLHLEHFIEGTAATECCISILDNNGNLLLNSNSPVKEGRNSITLNYKGLLKLWSPESPNLYRLRIELMNGNKAIDQFEQNLGIKKFVEQNKKFYLNNQPCFLRGGTIVWHRWMRDAQGRDVGYDTTWFKENVVLRLKAHGANYIRFHLGSPPQRLLDLCDRYGLLVQYEWSFFHGMPATYQSLMEQLPVWFDLAMRHPSIAIYHPYNETEGDELKTMWSALEKILPQYPSIVLEERDVLHIHKYWWSLFENLGLYYDDYNQFDRAIMVDEFGGNYLDGDGELGGYTALKESYLRFLGPNNTPTMRLAHLARANGKVAEYWRRIGAAGVAPFTIASSWEDGNTWFMGKLREGKPKSVWNSLTTAWSPVAASLDLWDCNMTPGEKKSVPVHIFNDTSQRRKIEVMYAIIDAKGAKTYSYQDSYELEAYSKSIVQHTFTIPQQHGEYTISCTIMNPTEQVTQPVVSAWDIRVLTPKVPSSMLSKKIYIPQYESELLAFAQNNSLTTTSLTQASVVILSRKTWELIATTDKATSQMIQQAIENGKSVVMLDVGERFLGQGYPTKPGDLGPLQGVARVTDPATSNYKLFDGISLTFTETAEPESHLHPTPTNNSLWGDMPPHYTWLWNGMRAGLTSTAADMEIHGMSHEAFVGQWQARGADPTKIASQAYYAYELYGFYGFSQRKDDRELQQELKAKVEFLVQDAPALAGSINIRTPIKVTDLAKEYRLSSEGKAKGFTPLALCGKNLVRTPVVMVEFGAGQGRLILSQLLTAGRLDHAHAEQGPYGIRYDATAVQMVINMIEQVNK